MNDKTLEALKVTTDATIAALDAAIAALDAAVHFTTIGRAIQTSIAEGRELSDAELDEIHAETGAQLAAAKARAQARLDAANPVAGG